MSMYIDPRDVGCEDVRIIGDTNNKSDEEGKPRFERLPTVRRKSGTGMTGDAKELQLAVNERYGKLGDVRERGMTIILGDANLPIVYVS